MWYDVRATISVVALSFEQVTGMFIVYLENCICVLCVLFRKLVRSYKKKDDESSP